MTFNNNCYITVVMPPLPSFSKENILKEAVELVKSRGIEALNFRSLAVILGSSTTPVVQGFGKMDNLRREVFHCLHGELEQLVHKIPAPRIWIALSAAFVIYSWRNPKAAQALKTWFWGEGLQISWDRMVQALGEDESFGNWTEEQIHQAAFRINVYSLGMAEHAAQGLLYKPTEEGILQDLTQTLTQLILGGHK